MSRLTAHPGRLTAGAHLSVSSTAAVGAGGKSAGISPAATHSPMDPNTVEQLRINMQVCLSVICHFSGVLSLEQWPIGMKCWLNNDTLYLSHRKFPCPCL